MMDYSREFQSAQALATEPRNILGGMYAERLGNQIRHGDRSASHTAMLIEQLYHPYDTFDSSTGTQVRVSDTLGIQYATQGTPFPLKELLPAVSEREGGASVTQAFLRTASNNIYLIEVGPDGATLSDKKGALKRDLPGEFVELQGIVIGGPFAHEDTRGRIGNTSPIKEIVVRKLQSESQEVLGLIAGSRESTIAEEFFGPNNPLGSVFMG